MVAYNFITIVRNLHQVASYIVSVLTLLAGCDEIETTGKV